MRSIKNFFYLVVVGFVSLTCSPDCENITGVTYDNYPYLEAGQILIKASNINTLQNKNVYFNEKLATAARFEPGVGLVVTMPQGVTGEDVNLRIQDVDCADFVSSSLSVQPSGYFVANPMYVPPAPPQIIIPIPNPPLPPNINNAWLSPDNKDYCIWFAVTEIGTGTGNYIISPIDRPDPNSGILRKSQELSVKQKVCGQAPSPETNFYHDNPVYGMMSKTENKVQFWIDRTSKKDATGKSLGIEEFVGQFIDIKETPYKDDVEIGPPGCKGAPWLPTKSHMMMVTSKQTNRTLILYQQLP